MARRETSSVPLLGFGLLQMSIGVPEPPWNTNAIVFLTFPERYFKVMGPVARIISRGQDGEKCKRHSGFVVTLCQQPLPDRRVRLHPRPDTFGWKELPRRLLSNLHGLRDGHGSD